MARTIMNRKGVSSVLGALLIVLVTTSAGVGAYVFSNTMQSGLELSSGAPQAKEQMSIENAKLTFDTNNDLTIHARNTGPVDLTIAQVYVDNALQGASIITTTVNGTSTSTAKVGLLATISLNGIQNVSGATITTEYTQGTTHSIKLVTKSGAIFTTSTIKGI